ncbi:MAG: hypothetical protein R2751_14905 [Bacteroidales bacterium]
MWNASIDRWLTGSVLAVLLLGTASCGMDQKDILPEDGFLKIFNHPQEELAFYPESVVQLTDGGYLFLSGVKDELSETEYPYAYLTRTDVTGKVLWSRSYEWNAPASRMFLQDGRACFVAMNDQFQAFALEVDPGSGDIAAQHDLGMTMPLASYRDQEGKLLVLGYEFDSHSSWVCKFSASFNLERSSLLNVNNDLMQVEIQRHMNKIGQEYPFYIGEFNNGTGNGYYVSCFYNYTLRNVFLDRSSLSPSGDIYLYQTGEAVSSLIPKAGSGFGLTSYYEGNNFILPRTEPDVTASENIKDWEAEPLYELTFKAPVIPLTLQTEDGDFTLFASQTNASRIVLYQYAADSDSLVRTHEKGFDEQVAVADLVATDDGGVVILAGTFILGKYRRPVLYKMDPEEFLKP